MFFCRRFGALLPAISLCFVFLAACAQDKQALVSKLKTNPCIDTRAVFKLRPMPRPRDCLDDPPARVKYHLIPEYEPISAVMVSENLLKQHHDRQLVPALLRHGIDVWFLSSDTQAFESYSETLIPTLAETGAGRLHALQVNTNSAWTRDWAPLFATDAKGKELKLVDPRYQRLADVASDDQMPSQLKFDLKSNPLLPKQIVVTKTSLPVILEGGNLLCNDRVCFVSAKVAIDNPTHMAQIHQTFARLFKQKLVEVDLLPREPNGHMDLWAKFLKPDLLAIAELQPRTLALVPKEQYALYQGIQDFLNTQAMGVDKAGLPVPAALASRLRQIDPRVKIVRMPMPLPLDLDGTTFFRSYINSLLLNGKVLIPRFEQLNLPEGLIEYPDASLLSKYEQAVERVYAKAGYQPIWLDADRLAPFGGTWHCVAAQVPKLKAPQNLGRRPETSDKRHSRAKIRRAAPA